MLLKNSYDRSALTLIFVRSSEVRYPPRARRGTRLRAIANYASILRDVMQQQRLAGFHVGGFGIFAKARPGITRFREPPLPSPSLATGRGSRCTFAMDEEI